MRLLFYAQLVPGVGARANELEVVKTTKHAPLAPSGYVIKFDIDVPESVLLPEVKATLSSLETVTAQAIKQLRKTTAGLQP